MKTPTFLSQLLSRYIAHHISTYTSMSRTCHLQSVRLLQKVLLILFGFY